MRCCCGRGRFGATTQVSSLETFDNVHGLTSTTSGGYVTQPGNIFSATGYCRPFEEGSDGTVPSDAVVAVVLQRAVDAARDGNASYALIAGAAFNSDGATEKAGYQVPSPQGQAQAITSAWQDAGLELEQLDYVESVPPREPVPPHTPRSLNNDS